MWSSSIGYYLLMLKCPSGKIGSRLPSSANICLKMIWRQDPSVYLLKYTCIHYLYRIILIFFFLFTCVCVEIMSDCVWSIDRRTQHPADQHPGNCLWGHPRTSKYYLNIPCSVSVELTDYVYFYLPLVLRFRRIVQKWRPSSRHKLCVYGRLCWPWILQPRIVD